MNRLDLAYANGVIHGDGWLTNVIGLRVADREFAAEFARVLRAISGRPIQERFYRGYWETISGSRDGAFSCVGKFKPKTKLEMRLWLRGMFDSEGNASCTKLKDKPRSFVRSIEFFSTNTDTIEAVRLRLERIGIPSIVRPMKLSEGHKGTRPVFRVTLRASLENFTRFRDLVGTTIPRKAAKIEQICSTYHPNVREIILAAQAKCVEQRRKKLHEETIPNVIRQIADRIRNDLPVTIDACSKSIPNYTGLLRYFKNSELTARAKELL